MRCFGDVFEKTSTSIFLTMFFKTQNIGQTMHLTMLIAHPYQRLAHLTDALHSVSIQWSDVLMINPLRKPSQGSHYSVSILGQLFSFRANSGVRNHLNWKIGLWCHNNQMSCSYFQNWLCWFIPGLESKSDCWTEMKFSLIQRKMMDSDRFGYIRTSWWIQNSWLFRVEWWIKTRWWISHSLWIKTILWTQESFQSKLVGESRLGDYSGWIKLVGESRLVVGSTIWFWIKTSWWTKAIWWMKTSWWIKTSCRIEDLILNQD